MSFSIAELTGTKLHAPGSRQSLGQQEHNGLGFNERGKGKVLIPWNTVFLGDFFLPGRGAQNGSGQTDAQGRQREAQQLLACAPRAAQTRRVPASGDHPLLNFAMQICLVPLCKATPCRLAVP